MYFSPDIEPSNTQFNRHEFRPEQLIVRLRLRRRHAEAAWSQALLKPVGKATGTEKASDSGSAAGTEKAAGTGGVLIGQGAFIYVSVCVYIYIYIL